MMIRYPEHNYNTRNCNALLTPFPTVNQIKINYEYQYINIWNQLPSRLKDLSSLKMFKREFISNLLDQY